MERMGRVADSRLVVRSHMIVNLSYVVVVVLVKVVILSCLCPPRNNGYLVEQNNAVLRLVGISELVLTSRVHYV